MVVPVLSTTVLVVRLSVGVYIAEDALNLVEVLSLSTTTHGHTLVTYTPTDNRTTSTVVDRTGTTI